MSFAILSTMHFRYKGPRGKVIRLDDVTWLAQAVRDGIVTPDTLLAVGEDSEFKRAEHVVAYQQVVVGLERHRLGTAPTVERAAPQRPKKPASVRTMLLAGLALLAVAVALFVMRSSSTPPSPVSPVGAPAAAMQAELEALVTEFGDSVAVRLRHLESWVSGQRFDQKLQGRGLQNLGAQRSVRAAITGYLSRVDTLVTAVSVLSARLVLRADSLEGTDGGRAGLFAAVGDALRQWESELSSYAGIQRGLAAMLDSLARFAIERRQAFVVRDGEAVFLSREDGARYRQLRAGIDDLAGSERRWAEAGQRKYPQWMSGLAPADRPAFQGPLNQRSNQ